MDQQLSDVMALTRPAVLDADADLTPDEIEALFARLDERDDDLDDLDDENAPPPPK